MYKILIVDDEFIIHKGIAGLLKRSVDYFDVYEASDGSEALELIAQENIDAMLLDINMPKMNGLDVLKTLQEQKKKILTVVLTGYEEFDYAKKALEYGAFKYELKPLTPTKLLELSKELKTHLDEENTAKRELEMLRTEFLKHRQIQKNQIMQDLIYGNVPENYLKEKIKILDINLHGPFYQIIMIGIQNYSKTRNSDDYYLIEYSVNLYMEEYAKYDSHLEYFQINSSKYILIYNSDTSSHQIDIDHLNELKNLLEKDFGVICGISIGNICNGLSEISLSYNQADFTLRYLNLQQTDYIITTEETSTEEFINKPSFHEDDFILALRTGNTKKIIKLLNTYFDNIKIEENNFNKMAVYFTMDRIIIRSFETLFQLNSKKTYLKMNELQIMESIYQAGSIDKIRSIVENTVLKISNIISEQETTSRNTTITRIKELVENEYQKPLSMKYIAEKVYINHVYLGQLFKKETGMSLNDYINKVRINKAKKLLRNSNSMIYQIAEQVGFSDSQYFSLVFKKLVGLSPKQYKEMF